MSVSSRSRTELYSELHRSTGTTRCGSAVFRDLVLLDVARIAPLSLARMRDRSLARSEKSKSAIRSSGVVPTATSLLAGTLACVAISVTLPLLSPIEYSATSVPPLVPRGEASHILAADGSVLATFFAERREHVPLQKIPLSLQLAVVATEDRRFFSHGGIDARAAARALRRNLQAGDVHQGGSTITEQYVKNSYFPTEPRTLHQKLREAFLAREIERRMSKAEILEAYLNTAYFGSGAVGVEAAAQLYFGKAAESLELAESALLAGVIRAPESYNPRNSPWLALKRRNLVLEQMVSVGYLERNAAEAAKRKPLGVTAPPAPAGVRYPHFVEYVRQQLLRDPLLGPDVETRAQRLYRGGLVVQTTLRPDLQKLAQWAVSSWLPDDADPDAAVVTVDVADGRILAMVGGKDFSKLQFNLATDARRQPGSTFKVFALVGALRSRIPPQVRLDGSPKAYVLPTGEVWRVTNFEGRGGGPVSMWEATVHSINGAYADLAMRIGPSTVVSTAYAMGIHTEVDPNPAVVLGGLEVGVSPLEMASSFATLASGGSYVPPRAIDSIKTIEGDDFEYRTAGSTVLSPGVAWMATRILQDVVARGTGRRAGIPGIPVAGKTGTTENHADAWFVGYTPRLATAVWVGHPEGMVPMLAVHGTKVQGGNIPAEIWHSYMAEAVRLAPEKGEFPPTGEEVLDVWISPASGRLASEQCAERLLVRLPASVVPYESESCPPPQSITDTALPAPSSEITPALPPGSPTPSPAGAPRAPEPPKATSQSPEGP